LRCPHCGNENPETHRFCGMCGASLLQGPGAAIAAPGNSIPAPGPTAASRTPAPSASAPRSVTPECAPAASTATIPRTGSPQSAPPVPLSSAPRPAPAEPEPIAPRLQQRVTEEKPVISGPSFLGLNQPASTPKRGRLSIDPSSAPSSRNLDYLLEDEEPKSGGGWKVVLILIALALAVSFGYLRWKNQGLPFLNLARKSTTQVPAATPAPPAPDVPSNASAPTNSTNVPAGSATPSAPTAPPSGSISAPANAAASQPSPTAPGTVAATSAASGAPSSANAVASNSSSNSAPAITPTPAGAAANPSAEPQQPTATAPPDATLPAQSNTPSNSNNSNAPSADNEEGDSASAAPEPTSKPPAAIKRVDTVAEAQKYLYGKGAPQDCDRGLRLLKPAANAGNPKAMIEMGALYSAGLCTPRDLPTSYRWFAMALRKDPDNQSVATDLQKLWGEMTQPERQLAIRLSQ
jgi:hypothetical protein